MKSSALLSKSILAGAVLSLGSSISAQACAVCMGADENTGQALNGAIFMMLGFLAFIFAGIGGVAYAIWRRSREPLPPHAEFANSATAPQGALNLHL